MRIRPVRPGDGGELCHVFVRSVHALGATSYNKEQLAAWTSGINPVRLEARLLSTQSFVAEADGRAVGFASLDADAGELDFLYVHPHYARQGIGWALADTVEREAAKRGLRQLELTASLNAVPVYERLGFSHAEPFSKTINRVEVPCMRMRKELPRERVIHGTMVRGLAIGPRTECAHYHSELDIIALRFPCCGDFYPCYECHTAVADHAPQKWRREQFEERAILCGACGSQMTITEYLSDATCCPACGSAFNPGCRAHRHLYFEV